MDWRGVLIACSFVLYADGFSKYGRTCKDIGCLNSQVCVLAEDPCSFGRTSDCGTYPTCKKKSSVDSNSEPEKPSAPKPAPKPHLPSDDFDSAPNYKPPAPPGGNSPYGGSSIGGGSPYGGSSIGGGSPYGGSSIGGGSPYGGSSIGGGGSPYGGGSHGGGSPYGGSNGGGSPYGGNSNGGGSPYGSHGGSSPYGGSSFGGGSPYGSNSGGNPYGGSPYGGSHGGSSSSGGFGSSGNRGSPIDSILNTLNKYANGGGGSSSGSGGSGNLGSLFGNILGNLSKNGGLSNFLNTRPIQENPNYSAPGRSSNNQNYPSGYQPTYQGQAQNKHYGQSNSRHNGATTQKPVTYGWNVG